jgi:energy-converting hydrogenase B subunit D
MSTALWGLDFLLCGTLIWLAVQTLISADLFKAAVMFIVFGLMLALIWARLQAPDIALAEAAIGAGLTGALLLTAVAATAERPQVERLDEKGIDGQRTEANR